MSIGDRRPFVQREPDAIDAGPPVPVALVITELDVGGAERALVRLATGLDRARWAPFVVGLGPEGALADELRAAGIETICLDVDRRKPIRAVRQLAGVLGRHRPALVQSFLFHANVASRLAARLAGRPIVVGGIRVAEKDQRWHLRLERLTGRLGAGWVCVSEGVRRFSFETARLPSSRLWVIPNGVDVAALDAEAPVDRARIGVEGHSHLALFVGRITRQKAVDVLIEAARLVANVVPGWRLAIVGDGPERAALESITKRDDLLRDRIVWLGRRDDATGLMKAADVVVLPSRWEGMPNVVLEAMTTGRAVVGTRVEGTEDLVVPGATGWLVPPDDAHALADALIDAARSPERLVAFGRAGRDRVETRFQSGAVIAAYDRLWRSLLGIDPDRAPA
jgi:starch synthase (maltosyl-transferring)